MVPGKSLVTGGTGFIGSHLVEALLGQGYRVRCLVRKGSPLRWIQGLDIEVVQGDCRDASSLQEAVRGVDRVYHLAGVSKAVGRDAFHGVNAQGTVNLLRACVERNPDLEKFVYLSSLAAVGPSEGERLRLETDPCVPVSDYGRSKRQGEEAVLRVRDVLNVAIIRACAVYGPRDRDFLPVFRLIGLGIQIGLWRVEQRLSLCYVTDLVSALIVAGTSPVSSGEIFSVSDGCVYTWCDIAGTIAEAMEARVVHFRLPVSVFRWAAGISDWISRRSQKPSIFGRDRYQEMIQPNWCCDSSKAMVELGLSPCFDLKRGVRATVDWYRAEGWLRR